MERAYIGILIPFFGTVLESACVYLIRQELNRSVQRGLTGFASGVMIAASIWSLLIPAMEESVSLGRWAFLPAVIGFWMGIGLLLLLDRIVPHLHMYSEKAEGLIAVPQRTTMLVTATSTLHNMQEGIWLSVSCARIMAGQTGLTAAGAMALSLGIALQNLPEGAIISMPPQGIGSRIRAFVGGVAFWHRRTYRCSDYHCPYSIYRTRSAIPAQSGSRCHVLRRRRRTDSRNVGRGTLNIEVWRYSRFYPHDGP